MLRHTLAWRAQRRAVAARRHPVDQAERAEARVLAAIRRRLSAAPPSERWHVVGPHLRPEFLPMQPIPHGLELVEQLGRHMERLAILGCGPIAALAVCLTWLTGSVVEWPTVAGVVVGASVGLLGRALRWMTGDLR